MTRSHCHGNRGNVIKAGSLGNIVAPRRRGFPLSHRLKQSKQQLGFRIPGKRRAIATYTRGMYFEFLENLSGSAAEALDQFDSYPTLRSNHKRRYS